MTFDHHFPDCQSPVQIVDVPSGSCREPYPVAFWSDRYRIVKRRSISAVRSLFRSVFVTRSSHLDRLPLDLIRPGYPAHRCCTTCRKEKREKKKRDMRKSSAIGSFPSRSPTPTPDPEPVKRNEDCDRRRTPYGKGTSANSKKGAVHSPGY